jgi:hypothetical protein
LHPGAKNTEILRKNSDEEEAVCVHVMRVLMNLSPKRTPALVACALACFTPKTQNYSRFFVTLNHGYIYKVLNIDKNKS